MRLPVQLGYRQVAPEEDESMLQVRALVQHKVQGDGNVSVPLRIHEVLNSLSNRWIS